MATVLVVDDDDLVLQTLMIGLKSAGFAVLSASNGGDALRLLAVEAIDVVVTDMVMPEYEGIELITHLRREGCALPIIAITGGLPGDLMAGRDHSELFLRAASILGATRTLAKPFTPAQLVSEIKICLGRSADGVRTVN